ncbi:hypothetical protein, partial [Pseudomonas helleri]|uniref:hypothetical protein n=1 Tax=Pseudomonas helleri TaxID=1608996 RepID=UPI001E45D4D3
HLGLLALMAVYFTENRISWVYVQSLESRTQPDQQVSVSIEVPFGQQKLTLKWPSSDPDGCARFIREVAQ